MDYAEERNLTFVDNPVMAQPILDLLRGAGIEAVLSEGDDFGGLMPAFAFIHGAYIVVPEDQLDEAQRLIAAYNAAAFETTPELRSDGEDGAAS